ncbi:MAG: hypothetical protein HQK53_04220 [Oligoflexia bacterium]|nr:hypothetical protein [Oligoflexia bacterium]
MIMLQRLAILVFLSCSAFSGTLAISQNLFSAEQNDLDYKESFAEEISSNKLQEDNLSSGDYGVIDGAISAAVIKRQQQRASHNLRTSYIETKIKYDQLRLRVLNCLGRRFDEHKNGMITISAIANMLEDWTRSIFYAPYISEGDSAFFEKIPEINRKLTDLNGLLARCKSLKQPLERKMFVAIKDDQTNQVNPKNLEYFLSTVRNQAVHRIIDNYIHGRLICKPKSGLNMAAAALVGVGVSGWKRNCISFFGNSYTVISAQLGFELGLGVKLDYEQGAFHAKGQEPEHHRNYRHQDEGPEVEFMKITRGVKINPEYSEIKEYSAFSATGRVTRNTALAAGVGCADQIHYSNMNGEVGDAYGVAAYYGREISGGPTFRIPASVSNGEEASILNSINLKINNG